MSRKNAIDDPIDAHPAKRFFVEMFTRDISLADALLDLLDNCVDGIHRTKKIRKNNSKPYKDFWARIEFDTKRFSITDNCGGISATLAKKSAFVLGKPKQDKAELAPTVGMYGIGMKRSIFKMGQDATVYSQTDADSFEVKINKQWLTSDTNWELKLHTLDRRDQANGLTIEIKDLYPQIAKRFSDENFFTEFETIVAQHYALIIEKGFKVFINNKEVKPKTLWLLDSTKIDGSGLAPYLYQANIDGVDIKLAIGFYEKMKSPTEIDDELLVRRTYSDAGWTIICNDRVVVYNDKSKLTGWGEADVPNFHNQFIGISGIVTFYTNCPEKLPLTTTKRGLEGNVDLYLSVKNYMREGLKKFTSYTNKWKNFPEEEKKISASAKKIDITELLSKDTAAKGWKPVRGRSEEYVYDIPLPKPPNNNRNRIIHFTKPIDEIEKVAFYLFEDEDISPSDVGEECFTRLLKESKRGKK